MNRRTCSECVFWFAPKSECRIKSPVAGLDFAKWPIVMGTDWCGEFKLLPELRPCYECNKPVGERPHEHYMGSGWFLGPCCSDECLKKAIENVNKKD